MDSQSVPLREYLDERHQAVMRELHEIKEYQRKQNARVDKAEDAIIVLQERTDTAHRRGNGGLATGIASGLALAATMLWERMK